MSSTCSLCHRQRVLDDRCIIHAPAHGKDNSKFAQQVLAEIESPETVSVDLTGALYNGDWEFLWGKIYITKVINLQGANLNVMSLRDVTCYGLSCSGATLREGMTLENVTITGQLTVKNAQIEGVMNLSRTIVNGETDISPQVCKGHTRITNGSHFRGTFHFGGEFKQHIYISDTVFRDKFSLSGCNLRSGFGTNDVDFAGVVCFDHNSLTGELNFVKTRFLGDSTFARDQLQNRFPLFRECSLAGVRFLTLPETKETQIEKCEWPRDFPRWFRRARCHAADELDVAPCAMIIRLKAWLIEKGIGFVFNKEKRSEIVTTAGIDRDRFHRLSQIYRQLHKKYYSESRFTEAAEFYISFMTVKRKAETGKLWARTLDLLYACMSRYGESIGRPLTLLAATWLIGTAWWMRLGVTDSCGRTIYSFFSAFCANIAAALFFRTASYIPPAFSVQSNVMIGESFLTVLFLGFLALAVRRQFAPKTPMD